jgi:hypothetical protein
VKGHFFAKNALEGIFGVDNRCKRRRCTQFTERVGCNSTRTVGLQAGDSMCQSFEPNDTLGVLWQQLKPGNG